MTGVALGHYVRRLRLEAGLSQEALAERAGIGVATVAALEEGRRRRPYPNTLAAIATALHLEASDRQTLLSLAHAYLQGEAPVAEPTVEAEARGLVRRRADVPVPPTSLIGRDDEVAEIVRRLDPLRSQVRLLSLLGPGGVGKTRLAIAAAALVNSFADGVVFVDLSSLHDHRMVPVTIARTLNVRESDGRSARELLLDHLGDRQVLLVLDNFEHLLEAGAFVADLLAACPLLRVLVTSRIALSLRSEHRHAVPPLPTPEDPTASPAVRLFVERAQAVSSEFALDVTCAEIVSAICRRLDGIPLAIELAAARISVLTPDTLLARLSRRLPLLASGATDLPDRQRTLRNTLAWSTELLGAAERGLLQRLAVFANDWPLEAVEAVCAEPECSTDSILDRLSTLVDSSLVQRVVGRDGQPRFSMLETIREYALEGLEEAGELPATKRRHLGWSLSVVQPLRPTPPDPAMVGRLSGHAANLRLAIDYAIETGAVEQGLWVAVALSMLWFVRGAYEEGRGWLGALLEAPGADAPTLARAHALAAAGYLAYSQSDYAAARQSLLEGQLLNRELGDELLDAVIVHNLASTARRSGQLADAQDLYSECLGQFEKLGHETWQASALTHLALVANDVGETQRAAELAQRGLALFESNANTWGISFALRVLGRVAAARGNPAEARQFHEASLALDDEIGDTHSRRLSLVALANNALTDGDPFAAGVAYAESLTLANTSGDLLTLVGSLEGLALCSLPEGWETAVRVAGAADHLRKRLGTAVTAAEQQGMHTWLERARGALGEARFAAAWGSGHMLERAQAVADGLRLVPVRS